MKRYLGFNGHRYGDLFIGTAACRALKRLEPDCHVTMVINGDYRDVAPCLLDQDCIDRIHITHAPIGGFDAEDLKWIATQRFDHIFDPMQDHQGHFPWFRYRNQPQEAVYMHGIREDPEETGKLSLHRWFKPTEGLRDHVAFHGFAGSHGPNKKAFNPTRAQEIVDLIRAKGYKVLQLGLPHEPKLDHTVRLDVDYFTSVRNVLGCKALVTGDSGIGWAASCYDFPTLAMYSHEYYGEDHVRAIQPLNPNAVYLSADNVNQIPLEAIDAALASFLS